MTKNTKNGKEWDDCSSTKNRTGQNGKRTEQSKKKEPERKDLDEGPRSRMEQNDFEKVRTSPALSAPLSPSQTKSTWQHDSYYLMPKEGGKKPSPAQLPNLILPIWVVHVPIGLQNLRQTIFLELK